MYFHFILFIPRYQFSIVISTIKIKYSVYRYKNDDKMKNAQCSVFFILDLTSFLNFWAERKTQKIFLLVLFFMIILWKRQVIFSQKMLNKWLDLFIANQTKTLYSFSKVYSLLNFVQLDVFNFQKTEKNKIH